jgi:8-oxo-dGTP pyrophosphatase MutT (NUDIX family)
VSSHDPLSPPHPSATVILLRDVPGSAGGLGAGGFEVLLMRRGSQLAFHGGAWVFPGGRVEAIERALGDPLLAAKHAAVRETQEEAGVELPLDGLTPFSHWTTPAGLPRRFATWFFVASVADSLEVRVDGSEIEAHSWLTPAAALRLRAESSLELPPPTFVTLSVLAGFRGSAEVLRYAQELSPPSFVPRPRPHAQGLVSLYQGDVAYDDGDLERPGPRHRLCMFRDSWRYEQAP